ncbi:MAG: hypothetical protein UY10_C0014G0026 [Microgenomates group bacterium GW2011_GWA2_47_8]|nr:MAG: hypothetical protein UY10_C0014G0026 [Microgenomates group bacterium GW2011_GWA2_47_8]
MLGIITNDVHATPATNELTIFTHGLDTCADLHNQISNHKSQYPTFPKPKS